MSSRGPVVGERPSNGKEPATGAAGAAEETGRSIGDVKELRFLELLKESVGQEAPPGHAGVAASLALEVGAAIGLRNASHCDVPGPAGQQGDEFRTSMRQDSDATVSPNSRQARRYPSSDPRASRTT